MTTSNPVTRNRPAWLWLVATVAVIAVWLLGSQVDRSDVAYGQTVPGTTVAVSTSGSAVAKRRPQLASDPLTLGVYMVWEEGPTATNHGGNLYFAYRDPSGNWTAPSLVVDPLTVDYSGRFGAIGNPVNETHAHIQVDPAGNLHVVYAAERTSGGNTGRGVYYTVARVITDPSYPDWTPPVRLDSMAYPGPTAGNLYNLDNTRLFVGIDPGNPARAMGYVLWVGHTNNLLRLTRVAYGPGHVVTLPDPAPVQNPAAGVVGPVAVLEKDGATLHLLYVGTNAQTGNGFYAAALALNGGGATAPTWSPDRVNVAGVNGADCNPMVCNGATATTDDAGLIWIAANYDSGTTTRGIQTTAHDGVFSTPPHGPVTSTVFIDPRAGRQPVVVFEENPPVNTMVVLHNQCTYNASTGACTARDIAYRTNDGTGWVGPTLTGSTTGEQLDLTAVMVGDDLYYAWVGVNQSGTGQQAYFQWVAAP